MPYKENDYIYVTFFEYFNRMNGRIYLRDFYNCWCRVLSYDSETNTYDVITEFRNIHRKVPASSIHQKRTLQQGNKIRIKKLEPYYIWDKKL